MIATSRKRTYSVETSIATHAVSTMIATRISGKSSQVHIGATPKASRKITTATRFAPRLKRLVRTIDIGITRRGNWVLRTTPSWLTTELTASVVASWKKLNTTTLNSR